MSLCLWLWGEVYGDREQINRFFKAGEDDWVEINEAEYQTRKEMEVAKNGAD